MFKCSARGISMTNYTKIGKLYGREYVNNWLMRAKLNYYRINTTHTNKHYELIEDV